MLKASLKGLRGDLLVAPADEAEVVAAAGLAAQHGVPVTPRGAGTGNYGQAVPLQGGAVLDLSRLDRVHALDAEHGTARAGAGVLLADLEEAAREHGWELRQHPSTRRTATLGGFVAGGSTGVGGLLHGGTAEDGAVLAARVVTMEPEPRVLELEGRDVFPVVHAYGTNGILTEVTVPLARAHKWQDAVCAFDSLADAAGFALAAGRAPALIARAVSAFQAPIGADFFHTMTQLREEQRAKHLVLVQCTKPSLGPLERLASDWKGAVGYVESAEEAKVPLYEYCWNHTTLLGLKKDKAVTYLQAAMEPDRALALVAEVEGAFRAEEVMQHLEAVRFGGQVGFASLALLRPGSNARLQEIMDWHEAHGMPVFDPHTHVLEDGGMKEIDWDQYHFKKEADPQGLLNPGKMRAWDEADAIKSNSATDQQGAFTAAYRVADTSELKAEATAGGGGGGGVPRRRYWSHWTTQEMSAADLTQAVALLPIGAVEAHGPVLPLGTDAIHNKAILDRAVAALPDDVEVLVLPAQDVCTSAEHTRFAGTLSLSNETASKVWAEVGACVAAAGVRKLVLFNSHGGNQALAEVVARQLRVRHDLVCVLAFNLGAATCAAEMFPEEELKFGIHGGALETSVMLHAAPDLVHMDGAEDFASAARELEGPLQVHAPGFGTKMGWQSQDLNPAGVVGDARRGDGAKGERMVAEAAAKLKDLLCEVHARDADALLGSEVRYPPQGGR